MPTDDPQAWLNLQLGEPGDGWPGDSPEAMASPERLVVALARFLAEVHSHRADDGPDVGAERLVDLAGERCRDGIVDLERIDEPYRRRTPQQLWESARTLMAEPVSPRVVLGTGDLGCVDLVGDHVVGWRPGPYVGLGDPAMDVTWAAADIASRLGPAFVIAFAEAYGDDAPGPLRSEFWMTLGQLL